MALNGGFRIIEIHNLLPTEINNDSQEIIKMLKAGNLFYNAVLDDCSLTLRRLGGPVVQHNYREQNNVVDTLAKHEAKSTTFDAAQVFVVPRVYVREVAWTDLLRNSFERTIRVCNDSQVDRNLMNFSINPD